MKSLILIIFLIVISFSVFSKELVVSDSSLRLTDFQKKRHAIGILYKRLTVDKAMMHRVSSVDSDNHITYATDALSDIDLGGIEFFYKYRWNYLGRLKTSTLLSLTTSVDEPDLSDLEKSNYYFEFYGMYSEINLKQRLGYLFSVKGGEVELYGALGLGYAVFKLVENWKEVEGNTGDSVDLKSYARKIIGKAELGVDYRWSAQWGMNFNLQYTYFKVSKYHTDIYGYLNNVKHNGENDTTLDKNSSGNFSSLGISLGLLYNF